MGTINWKIIPFNLVLHRYRFKYVFHAVSVDPGLGVTRKIIRSLKIIHNYQLDNHSLKCFEKWLEDVNGEPIQPFVDYIKIYKSTNPIMCHYHSCLGKTVYINGSGEVSICPYNKTDVELNPFDSCSSIQEVFDTGSFRALLSMQINSRNICKQACAYYNECNGGCPLNRQEICPENSFLNYLESRAELLDSQCTSQSIYEEKARALSLKYQV